jgi:hypothetical protein
METVVVLAGPTFENVLTEIEAAQGRLREIGKQIIEKYPQSENLVDLATQLSQAVDGMDDLRDKLAASLQEASEQEALKQALLTQMSEKEIYQGFPDDEKQLLSEYLIKNKAGLADEAALRAFVQKMFEPKSAKEIIGEFNKPYIINLGKKLATDESVDEFDAYSIGMKYLQESLDNPEEKSKIIDKIADEYLKKMPHRLLHQFYGQAFV